MDTDCFTDIVAIIEMAIIVIWEKLSDDDRDLLIGFYSEIAPFSETMILIGDVDIPEELKNYVSIYDSFEAFSVNMKYVLLGAYRRSKKNENGYAELTVGIRLRPKACYENCMRIYLWVYNTKTQLGNTVW